MRYFCINIIEIIPQTFNIVVHEIRFALLLKTNIISFNFPIRHFIHRNLVRSLCSKLRKRKNY